MTQSLLANNSDVSESLKHKLDRITQVAERRLTISSICKINVM